MQRIPTRRTPEAVAFHAHLPQGRAWLALLIPILLLGSAAAVRAAIHVDRPTAMSVAASGLSPDMLKTGAASGLEQVVAPGGTGYTFEIVQSSTIVARPGGPLIDVPDPTDRYKSLGLAESYALATYLEHGSVAPAGFWSEILRGPETPDGKPDFTVDPELAALVRDGKSFRNDGQGWYQTQNLPGIGLDPATAGLLPAMLRNSTEANDVAIDSTKPPAGGVTVARTLEATTAVADVPGIIAVDLAAFTEITKPAVLSFDDQGRLVSMTITARNTGLEDFDLIVVTTTAFAYPDAPPDLPKPEPAYVAPAPTQGAD